MPLGNDSMSAGLSCYLWALCYDLEDGTWAHYQQRKKSEVLGSLSGGKNLSLAFQILSVGTQYYLLDFHIPQNPGPARDACV